MLIIVPLAPLPSRPASGRLSFAPPSARVAILAAGARPPARSAAERPLSAAKFLVPARAHKVAAPCCALGQSGRGASAAAKDKWHKEKLWQPKCFGAALPPWGCWRPQGGCTPYALWQSREGAAWQPKQAAIGFFGAESKCARGSLVLLCLFEAAGAHETVCVRVPTRAELRGQILHCPRS